MLSYPDGQVVSTLSGAAATSTTTSSSSSTASTATTAIAASSASSTLSSPQITQTPSSQQNSLPALTSGAIAGISVGVILFLAASVALLFFYLRRRKQRYSAVNTQSIAVPYPNVGYVPDNSHFAPAKHQGQTEVTKTQVVSEMPAGNQRVPVAELNS